MARLTVSGMDDYAMIEVLRSGWYGVECIRHFDIASHPKADGNMSAEGIRLTLRVVQGPVQEIDSKEIDPSERAYEFDVALWVPHDGMKPRGITMCRDILYRLSLATEVDLDPLETDEFDGTQFDINISPRWDTYRNQMTENLQSPYFAEFGSHSSVAEESS